MNDSQHLTIEVVLAEPTRCQKITLAIKPNTIARDALLLAVENGLDVQSSGVIPETTPLGVYAQKVADDYIMQDADRLEVYRALQQDPMELRRKRAQKDAKKRKN